MARGRLYSASGRSPASKPFTPSRRKRPNGIYDNGTWYCNCEPRKIPSSYTVKKPGPTKGRSFLRCHDCNFFMWDVDAPQISVPESLAPTPTTTTTPTKRASPTKKTRTMCEFFPKSPKPPSTQQPGPATHSAARDAHKEGMGAQKPHADEKTPAKPAQKRTRVQFEEDYFGAESSDEERQLLEAVERSAQKMQNAGANAGTNAGTTDSAPTPSASTAAPSSVTMASASDAGSKEDAPPRQPNPPTARTLFATPEAKRQKTSKTSPTTTATTATSARTGLPSPMVTPTANRTTQVATPAGPEQNRPKHDAAVDTALRDEVMALLRGQPISPAVARSVRGALDRQVERARGLSKGRDAVRDVLKQKDERIAQLQDRVVALENKLRAERESRTNMRAGIMRLYQDY